MPEVSECRINADWLSARLVGKQLHSMVFHPHSRYYDCMSANGWSADDRFIPLQSQIKHYRVEEVGSKGKLLYIHLHAQSIPPMRMGIDRYLHITHGMTGGWRDVVCTESSWSLMVEDSSLPISYLDTRKFGTLKVLTIEQHFDALEKLGPDALTATQEQIFGSIGGGNPNHTIREVLLNQSRVSGIGNYLVSEILYRASVNPTRKLGDVYIGEIQRIAFMAQVAAKDSYNYGGCTLKTWRNPEGDKGTYQTRLSVYGKTHCPLAHPVTRSKDKQGRTIWSCPTCQV